MMKPLGIGVIGCGNISATYFRLAPLFAHIEMHACADIDMATARARAAEFKLEAQTVKTLLANPAIDIVVNLTVPATHFKVSKAILEAGKHVYSEKPLVLSLREGLELKRLAKAKPVQVACAPDTFLGGAQQLARQAIDAGAIGKIASGTAHVLSRGMEHWHPNPDFFFKPGGGPMLDLGPYYIAALVNLLGPVKRVAALTGMARKVRVIASAPRRGEKIKVTTPTTINALLDFAGGAQVTLSTSWDVYAHRHQHIELYGTEGAMFLPDPNFFGGTVEIACGDGEVKPLAPWHHPFAPANEDHPNGKRANYRAAGLADLAQAIRRGRQPRCSLDFALHTVDIMTAILKSGETERFVALTTTCARPKALGISQARALLR